MRKKLFIVCIMILSANSFSFWPMRTIYCDPNRNNIRTKVLELSDFKKNGTKIEVNAFLYDAHTFNRLEHQIVITDQDRNQIRTNQEFADFLDRELYFLECDFKYDNSFWRDENLKKMNEMVLSIFPYTYNKKQLIFNIDDSIHNVQSSQTKRDTSISPILFSKQMFSRSGVKIENADDEVMIERGGKKRNLTSALRNYWNDAESARLQNFSTSLIENYNFNILGKKNNNEVLYSAISKNDNFPMTKLDLERLNSSKILAVWRLIPVETEEKEMNGNGTNKIIESQMLGLAKDKDGKLFHWSTDLGKDISHLIPPDDLRSM